MPEIYTNPYGTSPAAQSTQSLTDTLSTMSKIPKDQATPFTDPAVAGYATASNQASQLQQGAPAVLQDQKTQQLQQAGVPQMGQQAQDLSKMYELYIHDKQTNARYANPNPQQPSDVPTFGSVGAPQLPVMTQGNVNQPFQGFSDPSLALQAQQLQGNSIVDAMNNLLKYQQFNKSAVDTASTQNAAAYQAQITGEQDRAKNFLELVKLMQTQQKTQATKIPMDIVNEVAQSRYGKSLIGLSRDQRKEVLDAAMLQAPDLDTARHIGLVRDEILKQPAGKQLTLLQQIEADSAKSALTSYLDAKPEDLSQGGFFGIGKGNKADLAYEVAQHLAKSDGTTLKKDNQDRYLHMAMNDQMGTQQKLQDYISVLAGNQGDTSSGLSTSLASTSDTSTTSGDGWDYVNPVQ